MVWRTRKAIWALQNIGQPKRPIVDAGPVVIEAIRTGRPMAAGKIGFTELLGVRHFVKRKEARAKRQSLPPYPPYAADTLFINSGVFPKTDEFYDRFGAFFIEAIADMDVLASWGLAGEAHIFNTVAPEATLVTRMSLEPYLQPAPWTAALEGKRVLIVSPFIDTISQQYKRREEIWEDKSILPAFTMLSLRAPFSAGLVPPKQPDWIAAVEELKAQMDAIDFDVALIGAGAFSLPLATHAKKRGGVGVHMGGSLQLLFGVYGNRWKEDKEFQRFFNDSWVRPSDAETPQEVHKNENACYW
ncbi:hypothetical protein CR492_05265 [Methylocella silvestris]|uniref:Uncharacterized protein n=1 Tax=Methylocella silvestris TaxID=199596 RepID=A0A2J7TJZ9_METSI|nr:hypothetical protein CR492_05265 [Methylocella silvestris]